MYGQWTMLAALLPLALGASAPAAETVRAIAAGGSHGLALLSDGTVWAWGHNDSGQLGDGTTRDRPAPVRVNGLSGVVAVAAGGGHSLALTSEGSVWAWGMNADGQTALALTPIQVRGLAGVVAIAGTASLSSSLALKSDGTVWGWDNSLSPSPPRQVSGLTEVVAVAGGGPQHGLALKPDGTVWVWGIYVDGTYRLTPRQIDGLTSVVAISAAGPGGLALKSDGTVWGWSSFSPAAVQISGLDGIVAIAGGGNGNLALQGDGTVWQWGYGAAATPEPVSGIGGGLAIASGGDVLVLKGDGTIWALRGDWGQVGDGLASWSRPVQVAGIGDAVAVAAGAMHLAALKADGTVWAWGYNETGQLGDGTTNNRPAPVRASGLSGVVAVAAGSGHSLALKGDGTVWEWGLHWGDREAPQSTPAPVGGLSEAVAIAAGNSHSLALRSDGTVWAWGRNASGQLGDGTTENRPAPIQVHGLAEIVAVAAGSGWDSEHSLALKSDGTVWGWGHNRWGELGDGTTTNRLTPVSASGLHGVVAIAAGDGRSLAVKGDGTIWAWGIDGACQVNGITAVTVVAGGCPYCGDYNLALRPDGAVWAWGNNFYTQLGDGTATNRSAPVQVAGLTGAVAIAAGWDHSLALKRDGTVWTWGLRDYGMSTEEPDSTPAPIQVVPPGSPDLAIAMSHDGDFSIGGQGVYTVTLTNIGLTPTAGTITVSDLLPPGLKLVAAGGAGWSCSPAGQEVTCANPGPVEPGVASTIRLAVEIGSAAWPGVTNLAMVSNASDRNPTNNVVGEPTVIGEEGQ